ncbi:MAG: LapA family protein [Deltaproteobacteria bacterium]|nr:LapA family protein [Deltaproteobacteria bacterium]
MKTAKLVSLLVLAMALVVVIFQNTSPVQIRFLWLSGGVPIVLLLLMTAVGGFVMGLIVAMLIKGGANSKNSRLVKRRQK